MREFRVDGLTPSNFTAPIPEVSGSRGLCLATILALYNISQECHIGKGRSKLGELEEQQQ